MEADIVTTPAFDIKTTTYRWTILPAPKNGTFALRLSGDNMKTPWPLPTFTVKSSSLDEFEFSFDGRKIPTTTTALVYRGVEYTFGLLLPKDSLLIGKKVTPVWGASGANLGVTLEPAIGTEVTLRERTEWKVKGGDIRDGLFSVKFSIEGFAQQLESKFSLAYHRIIIASISTEDELVAKTLITFEARIVFEADPNFPVKNAQVRAVVLGIPLSFPVDSNGVALIPIRPPTPKAYTLEVRANVKTEDDPVVVFYDFEVSANPDPSVFRNNTYLLLTNIGTYPIVLSHLGYYLLPRNMRGVLIIDLNVGENVVSGKKVGIRISPLVPAPVFSPALETLRTIDSNGLKWNFDANNNTTTFILEFFCQDYPDSYKMVFEFK
ncbi:hypothetical protein ACYZT9_15040 [Pseudomonas sp. ZT5P21]